MVGLVVGVAAVEVVVAVLEAAVAALVVAGLRVGGSCVLLFTVYTNFRTLSPEAHDHRC